MKSQKAKGKKVCFITVAICLILYLGSSFMVGFPLGFGRIMAQDIVKGYCNVIYPEATIEKTVFNPVNSVFETEVYLSGDNLSLYYAQSR